MSLAPDYSRAGMSLYCGDCLDVLPQLPERHFHCVVTSPPYWGLRDYGVDGQLGLEPTSDAYVAKMVEVFRAVRRVLRDDGTVWLNLGDSYSGGTRDYNSFRRDRGHVHVPACKDACGMPPKNLCGIPWRVAFALQADGWFLRSDIIWAKPNPMPESCTDRPTKAHEYVFLLSKKAKYFYDGEAVKEGANPASQRATPANASRAIGSGLGGDKRITFERNRHIVTVRNRRTVWGLSDLWTIPTQPYKGAHFATFPEKLVEPCVLAGTSEAGCCEACGAPWVRVVEKTEGTPDPPRGWDTGPGAHGPEARVEYRGKHSATPYQAAQRRLLKNTKAARENGGSHDSPFPAKRTIGWDATCDCGIHDIEDAPCRVLDPFSGSGTVGVVAIKHGRHFTGIELSRDYLAMSQVRIERAIEQVGLFTEKQHDADSA